MTASQQGDTDMTPQIMINEAENKAAEFQLAGMLADRGCPPKDWNPEHPRQFGVFQRGRNDFAVVPLFSHAIEEMRRDGFRCVYRTA